MGCRGGLSSCTLLLWLVVCPGGARGSDCNGNGVEDGEEIAMGEALDCNSNGVPDACDLLSTAWGHFDDWQGYAAKDLFACGDFDGNGKSDVAISADSGSGIFVRLAQDDGTLGASIEHRGSAKSIGPRVCTEDLDRDGDIDVAAQSEGGFTFFLNDGHGAFPSQREIVPTIAPNGLRGLEVADLDGLGGLDLVYFDKSVIAYCLLSGEDDSYSLQRLIPSGFEITSLVVTDLDGDGRPDVALTNSVTNFFRIVFAWNQGGGLFASAPIEPDLPSVGGPIVPLDIDGDRLPDIITTDLESIWVLRNRGDRAFGTAEWLMPRADRLPQLVADVDGDGDEDLVLDHSNAYRLDFLLNDGVGGLVEAPALDLPEGSWFERWADVTGDGRLDLLVQTQVQLIAVYPNQPHPPISLDCNRNGVPDECDLAAHTETDSNGNGVPDSCDGSGVGMRIVRELCSLSEPDCIPDGMAIDIVQGEARGPVAEFSEFREGASVEVEVSLDTRTMGLHAFEYCVAHDAEFLELVDDSLTLVATDAGELWDEGYRFLKPAPGGFAVAVILSFVTAVSLPPGHNSLARATYRLRADPGSAGARIAPVAGLMPPGAQEPYRIAVTRQGDTESRRPATLADAVVRRRAGPLFVRSDADGSSTVNITDAIRILGFLFLGAPDSLECPDAADANDDGKVEVSDAISVLRSLFATGAAPPAPYPYCGIDPTPDALDCATPKTCAVLSL